MRTSLAFAAHAAAFVLPAAHAMAQPVEPIWTGPYVGANVGANLNNSPVYTRGALAGNAANVAANARPPRVDLDRNGLIAGGQIGYNQQFGRFVGGLEADAMWTDTDAGVSSRSPQDFGAALAGTRSDVGARLDYLGTARARGGLLVNPRTLIYGTGGYAYGQARYGANFYNSAGATQFSGGKDQDASGWTAGGGVEYAMPFGFNALGSRHAVTLKAEYLHYDLGKKDINVAAVPGVGSGGYVSTFKTLGDVVRAGINVKF